MNEIDKIKYVRIKDNDNLSEKIPFTIDAENVDMDNGKDLQDIIGNINVDTDGNIAEQLENLNNDIDDLNDEISKKPYYFNTVNDMQVSNFLKVGDMAITLGYYEPNDGGAGKYNIISGTHTDDGGSIHALNNNLYAELIIKDEIDVAQFGAKSGDQYDATVAIQAAINYCMNNGKSLLFSKHYYVSPQDTTVEDKVCLYIYDNGAYNHMYTNNISFNFINKARIQTTYNDDCTLLRINAGQLKFNKLWLIGVRSKTDLLNLGRINSTDLTEGFKTSYDYFEKIMLQQGKIGLYLEGASYYNTFNTGYIRDCDIGIEIGFSRAEKAGLKQDSACNRNNFMNFTFMADTLGINITYGDTNKFVNTCFEGVTNGINIDDPQLHTSDFPIVPTNWVGDNNFINTTFERTSRSFYNNCDGTKIINTSTPYIPSNWLVKPQYFIGGYGESGGLEKWGRLYKICEDTKPYTNVKSWSTYDDSDQGFGARTFYDYNKASGEVTALTRQTLTFEIKEDSNITGDLTTEVGGILCKSIGGVVFITGKIKFQPTDQTKSIKLYFPEGKKWITNTQAFFGNIRPMKLPIVYADASNDHFVICNWENDYLKIDPPSGGWVHAQKYNDIFLNVYGFRKNVTW